MVTVSVAEVTLCAWIAAASIACPGVSGVLAGALLLAGTLPLDGTPPPDEQAVTRISAAADRPTARKLRWTALPELGSSVLCPCPPIPRDRRARPVRIAIARNR